jgi:hypothetical protein
MEMIEWTITITNVDVPSGRADVSVRRVDTVGVEPEESYNYNQAIIATPAGRASLLTKIKASVEENATKRDQVNVFLNGLAASAKANLEAWELTR